MRIGPLDAPAVVGELRQIHEEAEDPDVERMPADDELFGALLYVEKHVQALRRQSTEVQRAAALKRVQLWEYLREQTEIHQARAVDDARNAGAQWIQLAPAMAVGAPNAAYNKAKRLKAVELIDETPLANHVRRTPEAVLKAERRLALEQAAERRAQEAAQRLHELMVPVATRLLEQREALLRDDDIDYWLEEIEAVLPHCQTPLQMVSLNRYLDAALRALTKLERRSARSAALTEEARLALAAAVELQQGQVLSNEAGFSDAQVPGA
ncbi:hypothetical protein GCM10010121_058450 [Streptomyces brasiliensis]|uniref:Uncharacterized protein n=2 Tax=Streptomyces brasiliensis TaxID=1954 RepID=A0A917NY25_9ACTN|nr:hypothetical protein GCM10010121_058450 [Streptomyces brasiliensis]